MSVLAVQYTVEVYAYVDTDTGEIVSVERGEEITDAGQVFDEQWNLVKDELADAARKVADETDWPAWDK